MTDIDVTMCPDCDQKGRYEGRVLINGRGFYTCPNGHRWQNADEKPTTKGVALIPAPDAVPSGEATDDDIHDPDCTCGLPVGHGGECR